MSARRTVMANVRRALEHHAERTPMPQWNPATLRSKQARAIEDRWAGFARNLRSVNGTPLQGLDAIGPFLKERAATVGYCDPRIYERVRELEAFEGLTLHTEFDRSRVDDYAFGITRASGGIRGDRHRGLDRCRYLLPARCPVSVGSRRVAAVRRPVSGYSDLPDASARRPIDHLGHRGPRRRPMSKAF